MAEELGTAAVEPQEAPKKKGKFGKALVAGAIVFMAAAAGSVAGPELWSAYGPHETPVTENAAVLQVPGLMFGGGEDQSVLPALETLAATGLPAALPLQQTSVMELPALTDEIPAVAEETSLPAPTPIPETRLVLHGYTQRQLTSLPGIEAGPAVTPGGGVVFYHALVRPVAKYGIDQLLGGALGAPAPTYTLGLSPLAGGQPSRLSTAQVPRLGEIVAILESVLSGDAADLTPDALAERVPGTPRFSPDNTTLFSMADEVPVLMVSAPDGSLAAMPLTSGPLGMVSDARWAPDSRAIALIADTGLFVYDLDAHSMTSLGEASSADWSDSSVLIFSRGGQLYSVDVREGEEPPVGTMDIAADVVRVSPGGERMAYLTRADLAGADGGIAMYDLHITDGEGGEAVRGGVYTRNLEWSPDGETLAVGIDAYSVGILSADSSYLGTLRSPEGMAFGRFSFGNGVLVAEASKVEQGPLDTLMAQMANPSPMLLFRMDQTLAPLDQAMVQDLYAYELDIGQE